MATTFWHSIITNCFCTIKVIMFLPIRCGEPRAVYQNSTMETAISLMFFLKIDRKIMINKTFSLSVIGMKQNIIKKSVFLLLFHNIFWLGLPAYFSNHSPFSREHIFVGFNKFPSLVCWRTVIHCHRPQGPTLFQRMRWDFMLCSVMCAQTRDLLF